MHQKGKRKCNYAAGTQKLWCETALIGFFEKTDGDSGELRFLNGFFNLGLIYQDDGD